MTTWPPALQRPHFNPQWQKRKGTDGVSRSTGEPVGTHLGMAPLRPQSSEVVGARGTSKYLNETIWEI